MHLQSLLHQELERLSRCGQDAAAGFLDVPYSAAGVVNVTGMVSFDQIAVVFERAGLIIDACVSPPLASRGGFSFFWLRLIETSRGAFGAGPNEQGRILRPGTPLALDLAIPPCLGGQGLE